ncbi:MAG: VCBS repeat-containing protein, partial [Bacteroidia bacterium]|nr:VCBS repeat-containing protein [Bacteroidia bacterium]
MINLFTPKSGLIKLIGSFALICLFMGIQAAYSQILPDSLITDSLRGIKAIKAADVNGDGNLDLVIAASSGDNVWFVSGNGDLTFNTAEMVTDLADRVQDVTTGDLDSDGDLDIISAEDDNDIVAWFENDGMGTWTRTELSITMERCRSVNVG